MRHFRNHLNTSVFVIISRNVAFLLLVSIWVLMTWMLKSVTCGHSKKLQVTWNWSINGSPAHNSKLGAQHNIFINQFCRLSTLLLRFGILYLTALGRNVQNHKPACLNAFFNFSVGSSFCRYDSATKNAIVSQRLKVTLTRYEKIGVRKTRRERERVQLLYFYEMIHSICLWCKIDACDLMEKNISGEC